MRFHFGWKSHFGVQSALYLCSHELRRNEPQNGMDVSNSDSLDVAFNMHGRLKLNAGIHFISVILTEMNFISGDKISCKHYPKWNAYTCPSKYQVVLKFSQNEISCEQNLFSRWFVKSQNGMSSFCLSCERTPSYLSQMWYFVLTSWGRFQTWQIQVLS